jgi:hypothetical protein
MQRALNQSYAERDKLASDVDKIRDDLERSQVTIAVENARVNEALAL